MEACSDSQSAWRRAPNERIAAAGSRSVVPARSLTEGLATSQLPSAQSLEKRGGIARRAGDLNSDMSSADGFVLAVANVAPALIGIVVSQHAHRREHDHQVTPERPVLQIFEVAAQPRFQVLALFSRAAKTADLR